MARPGVGFGVAADIVVGVVQNPHWSGLDVTDRSQDSTDILPAAKRAEVPQ